jgi:hypothetical protein
MGGSSHLSVRVSIIKSFALTEPLPKPMAEIPSETFVRVSLRYEDVVDDIGDRMFRSGNTPGQRHAMRDVSGGTPKHHLER